MAYSKYGSGEYAPTPSHTLPAFTNGIPTGYMCTKCGHIQRDLDPIFEDLCLVCLRDWAITQGVSRVIPTAKVIEHEKALEPTQKLIKNLNDATTIIMNFKPETLKTDNKTRKPK